MISFTCPGCGNNLKVRDEFAGKRGKCPKCGQAAVVPVPGRVDALTLPPEGARSSAGSPVTLAPSGVFTEDFPAEDGRESNRYLTEFLAPPQAPGDLGRLGPYRVLRVLGAGGMGVVYRAEDPALQRPVALKAMLPALAASATATQRFLREARALAAVKHEHVVTVYQVDEDRGVPYLAMEFLEGESLEDRLAHGRLLPAEVLRTGREVAEGLAAVHERGLIHRDVKPANIWLEAPRGKAKVLDFGLARGGKDNSGLTQQGAILGTPSYMAPEQAAGQAVDARCDLFSLGCVLYRMTTGELPFKGTDPISTIVAVATMQPVPPARLDPGVPAALSDLIMELLAKDPEQRPASARNVADALAAIAADLSRSPEAGANGARTTATDKKGPPPVRKTGSRGHPKRSSNRLALGACGLLVVVLLVVVAVIAWPAGKGAPTASLGPTGPVVGRGETPTAPDPAEATRTNLPLIKKPPDEKKGPPPEKKPPNGKKGAPPQAPGAVMLEGGETFRFTGHTGVVVAVAFAPDGRRVASAGIDKTLRVWDLTTGKAGPTFDLPDRPQCVAFARGGQRVRVACVTGTLAERDLAGGAHPPDRKGHYLSPDGDYAVVLDSDIPCTVHLWNLSGNREIGKFRSPTDARPVPYFTPDGAFAVFCDGKVLQAVHTWDASVKDTVTVERGGVSAVACVPGAGKAVLAFRDNSPAFWDLRGGGEVLPFQDGHSGPIGCLAITPNVKYALSGGRDAVLRVWEVASGKLVAGFRAVGRGAQPPHRMSSLAVSLDGRLALTGGEDHAVRLWDLSRVGIAGK
jgi:serine/threonine protein kinase